MLNKIYGVFDSALNEWTDLRVYKNDTIMKRSFYMQFKDYPFTNSVVIYHLGDFAVDNLKDNPIYPKLNLITKDSNVYASFELGKGFLLKDIISEVAEALKSGSLQMSEADLETVMDADIEVNQSKFPQTVPELREEYRKLKEVDSEVKS
jgi:hypothetical protein